MEFLQEQVPAWKMRLQLQQAWAKRMKMQAPRLALRRLRTAHRLVSPQLLSASACAFLPAS
jgi:hypothetical protein